MPFFSSAIGRDPTAGGIPIAAHARQPSPRAAGERVHWHSHRRGQFTASAEGTYPPIVGIYPTDAFSCMRHDMHMASWFVVAKDWPSARVVHKSRRIHTVEHDAIIETRTPCEATWRNLLSW